MKRKRLDWAIKHGQKKIGAEVCLAMKAICMFRVIVHEPIRKEHFVQIVKYP